MYGLGDDSLFCLFLEELSSIQERWERGWCIGGDINEVLEPSDRNGGGRRI